MKLCMRVSFGVILLTASALTVLLLLGLSEGSSALASRAGAALVYVAPGAECGGMVPCYADIQAAVDAAAPGGEVRVAAGTYMGTAPATVDGRVYTGVVVITKSLDLLGGYSPVNWVSAQPSANVTTIDAGGSGRALSVVGSGDETVTVAGFVFTGGDYTGLGNLPGVGNDVCARTGSDCGGGLYASKVRLLLRDALITGNTASRTTTYSDGGGAYLWQLTDGSRIDNTTFISNTATAPGGQGGGLTIHFGGGISIAGSTFRDNESRGAGGGAFIFQPRGVVHIEGSTFLGNRAASDLGGGLEARLVRQGDALRLQRVTFLKNRAFNQGAALSLIKQGSGTTSVATDNVLLAGNVLDASGPDRSVVNAWNRSGGELNLLLAHMTWAAQEELSALRLEAEDHAVRATLTNTLVVSASSAFVGAHAGSEPLAITHTHTLVHAVGARHTTESGTPTFLAISPLSGDPRLGAGYRLRGGSAAIDAGVQGGVFEDIDGQPRPTGALPDIGADEYVPSLLYLPALRR